MLMLSNKAVDFTCTADDRSCVWSADGLDLQLAYVCNNGGTSTFTGIAFRDGNPHEKYGGGLDVAYIIVNLIRCEFTNNHVDNYDGGGGVYVYSATATFTGVKFEGNTAGQGGTDIYTYGTDIDTYAFVAVEVCPSGYDEVRGDALGTSGDITGDVYSFECTKSMVGANAVRTDDTADAFKNAVAGDEVILNPGTCNKVDGLNDYAMLYFSSKAVDFTCTADDRTCIWSGEGLNKLVVDVKNNGGMSTFTSIAIRDGEDRQAGGGMYVDNSIVHLILCSFINNHAQDGGAVFVDHSAPTTFTGVKFEGNTADHGNDIATYAPSATAKVTGCPADYDEVRGDALDTDNHMGIGGTITGDVYSFVCTHKQL